MSFSRCSTPTAATGFCSAPEGRSAGQVRAYAEECAEIYVPPTAEGRVLALSTCHGDTFSSRLLVLGILIVE